MPVIEVRHPLVRHKVGLLRDASLSTKSFREITAELGRLLTYEATSDFPLERVTVTGWSGPVEVERVAGKKVTVVPILRAGLGLLDGVLDTIPNARVSVVGIARNHVTLLPEPYIDRLASSLDARTAIVLDPMLATGGSMISAIDLLKSARRRRHTRPGAGGRARRHRRAARRPPRRALLGGGHRHPPERAGLHIARPGRRRRSHLRNAVARTRLPAQIQPRAPTTAPAATIHMGLRRVFSIAAIAAAIRASAPQGCGPSAT